MGREKYAFLPTPPLRPFLTGIPRRVAPTVWTPGRGYSTYFNRVLTNIFVLQITLTRTMFLLSSDRWKYLHFAARSTISITSARVSSGFQTRENINLKQRGRSSSGFIVFKHLETWWNPKHEFLKWLLLKNNTKLCSVVFFPYFLKMPCMCDLLYSLGIHCICEFLF